MKGNLSKRKGLLSEITEKHLSQIVNSLKEKVLSVLVLKEDVANKVTSLSADSTDIEYPSAKAVYGIKKALSEQVETELEDIKLTKEDVANKETEITEDSTDTGYPSSKAVKDYAQPKESGKGLSSNDFTDGFKTKLENIDENANNYILPDDVVKNTDYASSDKGGVVKVSPYFGFAINNTGVLYIVDATESEITNRNTRYKIITPDNLNAAVKAALSDAKRISDMTDEEKANARGVIGAAAEADCEKTSNKVTTITDASTDSQYPSAQAVYTGLNQKKNRKTILHPPDNIVLRTDCDYRYTPKLTSLTVIIQSAAADFDCYISFTSGATPTSLTYLSTIKWVGVDCDADGDFIPSANTNYEISIRAVNTDDSENPVIVARVGVY